jgi:uncharacterized membrane protein
MRLAIFAAAASAVFIAADAFMIPLVMRPMFKAALGDAMLDELRLGPAALFYIIHIGGVVYFAGRRTRVGAAFKDGAAIGLVAYSCYDMTSWTIMRDWAAHLVAIDIGWGMLISGAAAAAGAAAVTRSGPAPRPRPRPSC